MKSSLRHGLVLIAIGITLGLACSRPIDIRKQDCFESANDVIELSNKLDGRWAETVIKIYDPTPISRTDTKLVCEGLALVTDGDQEDIQFYVRADHEGDTFVGYKLRDTNRRSDDSRTISQVEEVGWLRSILATVTKIW